ncbi:MAG: nicotinate (nicotinamide) nucleotide adenylyltransferase [Treponema sp.]|jgi:nicotinate-nucleotide adenylyltransferase|nr:nicotinate (nicotinamide) nucleotide adenylyltransferase [Treponema sp.]
MRLAILGGSFNPVHLGHLYLADMVLSDFGYDRVLLIPTFRSPFKLDAAAPAPQDRLAMLVASIPGDPRLIVDDCEIRREGVSYTVDTLADVYRRYLPEAKPALILGDDLARDFPTWKKSAEILSLADIIIARRTLSDAADYPYPCRQLRNEVVDISSARLRDLIRQGKHWRYLVPAGARTIIEERGLYGFSGATLGAATGAATGDAFGTAIDAALIVRMEEEARRTLSLPRFLHSRQVAVMSSDLCRIFGLDSRAGYLAGIVHDIGKQLEEGELIRLATGDRLPILPMEKKKPSLLHGRAGAVLLEERYGIRDRRILDAVRCHTTGSDTMGPLAKVLYVADKIEVSREGVESRLRDFRGYEGTGEGGLDRLFGKIFLETVGWLRSKKFELSEGTMRLLEQMERGVSR